MNQSVNSINMKEEDADLDLVTCCRALFKFCRNILTTETFIEGRLCCNSYDWRRTNTIEESSDHHANILKVIATDVFDVEKPIVFAYEEVLSCTDFFSESNLLGHETYGSMYYGLLHEQDDYNENQRVHSRNESFVQSSSYKFELIGYAASDDELFLIYEYAQKGHPTLSWIMMVQIALDTAKGLTFHGIFLEQISDFGLAKLVGVANDVEASATRVARTFVYLAQEYIRDGLATMKSDIYAFGVLLFELISGKEA
nr:LysM domain receptor-like kinase 3 [Tanacetum cinerariifolium]